MAQVYVGTEGSQIVPGATASIAVQSSVSGTVAAGVVFLIGEADAGPDWTLESPLSGNSFGPGEDALMKAKYKSGNLVDAFLTGAAPLKDEEIQGAPSKIYVIKTNVSTKASAALSNWASGTYATLYDKSFGKLGNSIYTSVDAAATEVVPTTGAYTYIPGAGTISYALRLNGGAALTAGVLGANTPPNTFVAAIGGLAGITATGGADRVILTVSGTLQLAALGANVVTVTRSIAFAVTPTVGDTMIIPTGSVIAGAATDPNVGAYVITGATPTVITATKLSDAGKTVGGAAVPGVITAPSNVGPAAISAVTDCKAWSPVTISVAAGNPVDGVGKSLEIAETTTGTDLLSRTAFLLGSATAVSWVSKTGAAKLLTSATESRVTLNVSRQSDGVTEALTAGGEIGLAVSYAGTTASITISDTAVTSAVAGGSGAALPAINLRDFPTIADLAVFINSQTGWSAAAGSAGVGQQPATALDDGTFSCCSQFGAQTGRVKIDGYRFYNKVQGESILVQVNNPGLQAGAGLPKPTTAVTFLSGGTKGGTTAAGFAAALAAVEKLRGNFVVPLFSRDATADIADGLTESSSTYTIAAIHALVVTHMLKMQKLKQKKNRQGMLSYRGTYAAAKNAAASVALFRCSMSFLDQKVTDSTGVIKQFHPWMDAVIAACGQAAGVYKALVHKVKNISGSLQAAGDWDDQDVDAMEDALLAGLLPTQLNEDGDWIYVSDQTTYSKGNNFVYNSIQATYIADLVALTSAQKMEKKYTGKALADVGAQGALTFLEGLMAEFIRIKWLAPSDDALLGYKNAKVEISGPAMVISVEVKVDTALYFSPIKIYVSQVTQSASQ